MKKRVEIPVCDDNWESEIHETFCFCDFKEKKQNVVDVGFAIADNSVAYTDTGIVKNRWTEKVKRF